MSKIIEPASQTGGLKITACNGTKGGCRFALPHTEGLAGRLADAVYRAGWPDFLKSRLGGRIHAHQALSVGVSACANGCAKPQIKDFGVIAASKPLVIESACIACGLCREACPDSAISLHEGPARVDPEVCLSCGRCAAACPEKAIIPESEGLRVLLGGRLGRRPRLAVELPGLYNSDQALELFERMLLTIMDRYQPGKRYSELFDHTELMAVQA